MTFQKGNKLASKEYRYKNGYAPLGRPTGAKNITPAKVIKLVELWLETGNFTKVAQQTKLGRKTVTQAIKRWITDNPENYEKMLSVMLTRSKQMMIAQNTLTTQKALDKIDTLLDNADSLKETAMTYGILYDKGALMKGESTSNSAVVIKLGGLEDLAK